MNKAKVIIYDADNKEVMSLICTDVRYTIVNDLKTLPVLKNKIGMKSPLYSTGAFIDFNGYIPRDKESINKDVDQILKESYE